jgi:hydroxymethylglutaryl-CoA reductase
MDERFISGFSKLSKDQKLKIISENLADDTGFLTELNSLNHRNPEVQGLLEQFSENTLGNFPLPYSVAPNFLINDSVFTIPMVTEESSVVAAAASAARFWSDKGGFHAKVKSSVKTGQVHFCWYGNKETLLDSQDELKKFLMENTFHLTKSMELRGGGIRGIEIIDFTSRLEDYYQLKIGFETADSMGANFINTVLEEIASLLKSFYRDSSKQHKNADQVEIIMSILSNYTPDCIVECYVETHLSSFENISEELSGEQFAIKFKKAMDIASLDPYRAVTHNKGIFNGIDAVILATANDFRAVEAAGHAYASRNGRYTSLSKVEISGDIFKMSMELPMAVGTVGGLTRLHPMGKWSFEILNNPDAKELMMIIATAGLATNFSAIKSLITSGIQHGHMKMHLGNILSFLEAGKEDKIRATEYFRNRSVSYHAVEQFLKELKDEQ